MLTLDFQSQDSIKLASENRMFVDPTMEVSWCFFSFPPEVELSVLFVCPCQACVSECLFHIRFKIILLGISAGTDRTNSHYPSSTSRFTWAHLRPGSRCLRHALGEHMSKGSGALSVPKELYFATFSIFFSVFFFSEKFKIGSPNDLHFGERLADDCSESLHQF